MELTQTLYEQLECLRIILDEPITIGEIDARESRINYRIGRAIGEFNRIKRENLTTSETCADKTFANTLLEAVNYIEDVALGIKLNSKAMDKEHWEGFSEIIFKKSDLILNKIKEAKEEIT